MEEKKEYWQHPWWEAGFKTEDEWLNWWVSRLDESIAETQNKLNSFKNKPWEYELQLAEFVQRLCEYTTKDHDNCAIARVVSMSASKDDIVLALRGYYNGKFYMLFNFNVRDFLISYAASYNKWYEIAWELNMRLGEIVNIAAKIRRDILYPEVVELERRIMGLESKEQHLRGLLDNTSKYLDESKDRLAEREKEIENLYEAIEKAVITLDQTRKIFKSKTIAQIRKELTNALPPEKQTKFLGIQPSEPWPSSGVSGRVLTKAELAILNSKK